MDKHVELIQKLNLEQLIELLAGIKNARGVAFGEKTAASLAAKILATEGEVKELKDFTGVGKATAKAIASSGEVEKFLGKIQEAADQAWLEAELRKEVAAKELKAEADGLRPMIKSLLSAIGDREYAAYERLRKELTSHLSDIDQGVIDLLEEDLTKVLLAEDEWDKEIEQEVRTEAHRLLKIYTTALGKAEVRLALDARGELLAHLNSHPPRGDGEHKEFLQGIRERVEELHPRLITIQNRAAQEEVGRRQREEKAAGRRQEANDRRGRYTQSLLSGKHRGVYDLVASFYSGSSSHGAMLLVSDGIFPDQTQATESLDRLREEGDPNKPYRDVLGRFLINHYKLEQEVDGDRKEAEKLVRTAMEIARRKQSEGPLTQRLVLDVTITKRWEMPKSSFGWVLEMVKAQARLRSALLREVRARM